MHDNITWDIVDVIDQINRASAAIRSPFNDTDTYSSLVKWGIKQDLYTVMWLVQEQLDKCPEFVPEEAWLELQQQKKLIRILADDI